MRHGQSLSNVAETFTGSVESPLSDLGRRQAGLCAEYLKGIKFDRLFSSDLSRANETGRALGEILGMPVEKRCELREINGGRWEGLTFDEIERQFPESYGIWRNNMDFARPDGGENVADLQKRFVKALIDISAECEGGTVAVFTHATTIRTAAAYALGKTIQETPWPANSSVSEFECREGVLTLRRYGFNEFLGESVTRLPKNV